MVTFAAARAGDAAFKQAYDAAGIRCTRYEVGADVVPKLPVGPETPAFVRWLLEKLPIAQADDFAYVPLGEMVGGGGSLIASAWARLRGLFRGASLASWRPAVVAAHMITPDSDYDKLVCPRGEMGCAHD